MECATDGKTKHVFLLVFTCLLNNLYVNLPFLYKEKSHSYSSLYNLSIQ